MRINGLNGVNTQAGGMNMMQTNGDVLLMPPMTS